MKVILSPDDLKKGDLIPPTWYPAEIVKYSEEVTKGSTQKPSDGSMNAIFFFKILDGPHKGIELKRYFNEKALGFGKNLWKALEFPFDKEKGYDIDSDLLNQTVGSKVKIYVARGKGDNGKEFNEVSDFMKL